MDTSLTNNTLLFWLSIGYIRNRALLLFHGSRIHGEFYV